MNSFVQQEQHKLEWSFKMEIVIVFLSYFVITFAGTWRFLSFVKDKKWDVKSARILLAIFVGLAGFLILSISVYFIDGKIDPNKASLTLILGTVMVFATIIISVFIMHFIRKMKYVQVTFNLPENSNDQGSLSETQMTCLVDRQEVLNIQEISNSLKNIKKPNSLQIDN